MLTTFWRPAPTIARIGLVLAALGVVVDVIHHAFTHDLRAVAHLHIDVIGHVLTLAGMLLALVGVIHAAADMRRRARQKGESDAAHSSAAVPR